MKEARLIGPVGRAQGWTRDARLYELTQPIAYRTIFFPEIRPNSPTTRYIVISSGPDHTMAFPSNEKGYTSLVQMTGLARANGSGKFDEILTKLGYQANPFKSFLVTISWKDPDTGKWAAGYRKVPVLAKSAGAEVDLLIEKSFPAGSVKVIDIEACSKEDHDAVFQQIHQQECQESGIDAPFDLARHQPLKAS